MIKNVVDISIIIPTINRYKNLVNTINDLEKQKQVSFEIIIIDQNEECPIDIMERIKSNAHIIYLTSDVASASAARNIGIDNSNSDILLFIDDDVIIDDCHFVYNHYKHYKDKNTVGIVGRSIELSDNSVSYFRSSRSFSKNVGFFYFPKNYGCATALMVGRSNNLSVRKEMAIAVGGMDENYKKGAHREEGDFCLRISRKYGRFIYDPFAKLEHIGSIEGGIRSWNDSDYIKAKHNMVGAIYFCLKMAPISYKHEYYFAALRYFILNKTILMKPQLYIPVIKRSISALIEAHKLYRKGPKYLNFKNSIL